MTSVRVKFRPSTVEGREGRVYYQVIHDRTVRQVSSVHHMLPCEWDEGQSDAIVPANDPQRRMRTQTTWKEIRRDVERLSRIARRLEMEQEQYTTDEVVERFTTYLSEYTFQTFIKGISRSLRENGQIRTSETYASALVSFTKYLCETGLSEDIHLDCLTPRIMQGYEAWLMRRGVVTNTVSFYIRILRAVYNRAVEEGDIEDLHPFTRVYTGIGKTKKRALPLKTLRHIRRLDLSGNPAMEYARDMFMMSFFLRGMSFIDMAYLRKTDLRDGFVTYRRRKTGQLLTIGWTDEMQQMIDKYPDNPTEYLLPILRRTDIDERHSYRNTSNNINSALKKVAKMAGVATRLTLYVARHSWASVAKSKGIPLSVISEGMGHSSETTTRIYLASLETSVVDKANRVILKATE